MFIRMGIMNEKGAICYCEGTDFIRPYLNIEYLQKEDALRFTHMFVPFHILPFTQKFCEALMTRCHSNISTSMVSLAGTIH